MSHQPDRTGHNPAIPSPYRRGSWNRQRIGFVVGAVLFLLPLILPVPEGANPLAMRAAAVGLLMATWWVTEAIPISATALIPLVAFPLLGVLNAKETATNYGHNYVLMLLGGFFIAKAFELHNLHQRTALSIVKLLGTSRRRIILSFMVATAFLSMWIANVAVALLMLPIAVAIIAKEEQNGATRDGGRFGLALMLSIAYSASIGGTGTLIGTPPNMVFVGIFEKMFPKAPEISFAQWMLVGVPLVIVFLPIVWLYLTKFYQIKGRFQGGSSVIHDQLAALGPMTTAEKRVLGVFVLTAFGWVFRRDIPLPFGTIPGWSTLLGVSGYVHDSTVAMFSSLLLFIIPAGSSSGAGGGSRRRLLDWKSAESVPWGVAWIVAGGYALAMAFAKTGLARWLGDEISWLAGLPTLLMVLCVVTLLSFLTEINSNTATATIFLPVLAATAIAGGSNPYLLMIPATIACSCSFMLPSGTGTNAVIFASDRVTIPEMAKCGFWLHLIGVVVLTGIVYLLAIPIFHMTSALPLWAK